MEFVFALKQHVGAPAGPVVCEGDNIKRGQMIAAKPENANAAVVTGLEVYLELKGLIDTAKEKEKILKAKAALEKDIARTSGKLSNQGFLAKAPEAVVAKEKEKLAEFEEKLKALPITNKDARAFVRFFLAGAADGSGFRLRADQ